MEDKLSYPGVQLRTMAEAKRRAISLFSGAGGMDTGFEQAGFYVAWANDVCEIACDTYRRNHPGKMECGPIEEFLPALRSFEGIDLVFGGPPCQGFSVAGKLDPNDPRSQLLWRFFDAIEIVRPAVFVCENVKALAVNDRWQRIRRRMFELAAALGYSFDVFVLNSSRFGVPQSRERMFMIGCRLGRDVRKCTRLFELYEERPKTVREVLVGLGPPGSHKNKRVCKAKITMAARPVLRRSPYAGMLFNGQGRPLRPDGYSSTLHASMGGNKTPIIDEEHLYHNKPSWIEQYHAHLMKGGAPLPFDAAPARLRRLSVDEAILLQTFSAEYDFAGSQHQVFMQVGNAVPCKLAHAVARVTQDLLKDDFEDAFAEVRRQEGGQQLDLSLA